MQLMLYINICTYIWQNRTYAHIYFMRLQNFPPNHQWG